MDNQQVLGYLGLLFLVISLYQDDIDYLRLFGITSTMFYLVAYIDDFVLTITHIAIIGVYVLAMWRSREHLKRRWFSIQKLRTVLGRQA